VIVVPFAMEMNTTVVIVVGDIDGLVLEVIRPTEVMVVFPGNPTEEEDEAGPIVVVTVRLDEIVDVSVR
jgi:hypothetical protein